MTLNLWQACKFLAPSDKEQRLSQHPGASDPNWRTTKQIKSFETKEAMVSLPFSNNLTVATHRPLLFSGFTAPSWILALPAIDSKPLKHLHSSHILFGGILLAMEPTGFRQAEFFPSAATPVKNK